MAQQKAKFIKDKSVSSSPLKMIQWDADGDVEYIPNTNADWATVPTGALQALDELASRMAVLEQYVTDLEAIILE